jgi:hypothetical protein
MNGGASGYNSMAAACRRHTVVGADSELVAVKWAATSNKQQRHYMHPQLEVPMQWPGAQIS